MSELKKRFLSLDVFRGMTICFMIIVNTPAVAQKPTLHYTMLPGTASHPPISCFHPSCSLWEMQ